MIQSGLIFIALFVCPVSFTVFVLSSALGQAACAVTLLIPNTIKGGDNNDKNSGSEKLACKDKIVKKSAVKNADRHVGLV